MSPSPSPSMQPEPKAPFSPEEIARWRQRLIDLRQQLIYDIDQLETEINEDDGAIVVVEAEEEQLNEVEREEVEQARRTLADVDQALERINNNGARRFGICEETGGIIERERLELMPWTSVSSAGAQMREARSDAAP